MNLVLIGYRGTGKSQVGKRVAHLLGMEYVGMDAEIVERAGMTIPALVEEIGWPGFRDLESEVARDLAEMDNTVIDTGGGVIERHENIETLRANGRVVWLQASVETIVKRIHGDTNRPSLTGKSFTDEVAEVLERREPKYRAAADIAIDTDRLSVEQVAEKIAVFWKNR